MARKKDKKTTTKKKDTNQKVSSFFAFLKDKFIHTFMGKAIIVVAVVSILFFFNLLLSKDDLGLFTLFTGLELVLGMVISWAVFLYKRKKNTEETE